MKTAKCLLLVLGGARSGKSSYAERRAAEMAADGAVLYVATAQAFDKEMKQRIAAHQMSRPATWRTLEEPLRVAEVVAAELARADAAVVLVDCLTLWASNMLLQNGDDVPDATAVETEAFAALDALLAVYAASHASTIVVSNEVGMGLVPPYPLGRIYRDLLGRLNARLAAQADEVVLMIAGLPLTIKTPSDAVPRSPTNDPF